MSLSQSPDHADQKPGLDSYRSLSALGQIEDVQKGDIVMVKPEFAEKAGLDPNEVYAVYKVNREKGRICIVVNGYPKPESFKMNKFDLYSTDEQPVINVMSQMQAVNEEVETVLARRIERSTRFPECRILGVFQDGDGTLYDVDTTGMQAFSRDHHRNKGYGLGPMTVEDI